MNKAHILLAGILVIYLSCNRSVDPPTVDQYASTAGNTWSYLVTARLANIRILQPGVSIAESLEQWTAVTTCEGTEILHDSVLTLRFRSVESPGYAGLLYYISIGDTLFWYAYAGVPEVLPKRSPSLRYRFAGRAYPSLAHLLRTLTTELDMRRQPLDSIQYELRPPRALVFPLQKDRTWNFREKGYPAWLIQKKVSGAEAVTAAGTSYPCHVIEWRWDMNDDGAWDTNLEMHDYIHTKGLIKRSTIIRDINLTKDDPTPVAVADVHVDYVLTFTNVQ